MSHHDSSYVYFKQQNLERTRQVEHTNRTRQLEHNEAMSCINIITWVWLIIGAGMLTLLLVLTGCDTAGASEYEAQSFCTAVYWVEGGKLTKHPYGVLSVPCEGEAQCRQVCINSFNNNQKRFKKQFYYKDFLSFFASRWAPDNVSNDPHHLNANWISNMNYRLNHPKKIQ